jgi:hypothetical protein
LTQKSKDQIAKAIYFLVTTLVVIGPALYNRYPLVYFDSGAYMEMAANLLPSYHRALGYPLLMRLTGWMISNWPIVILQGFLVSILSFRLVAFFLPVKRYGYHFFLILVLSFTTSLSWYAAQLMPDIFTLILVLATVLILLETATSKGWLAFYLVVIFFSLLTHLSHIPLLLLVLAAAVGSGYLSDHIDWTLNRKGAIWLTAPIILAFFLTCSYNAASGFGFKMGLSSNVFITANIGEMGLLKPYLDEKCVESNLSLCSLKDSLPLETGGYLWDKSSPVQNFEGGWKAANEEYSIVVHDFMTSPKHLSWFLFGAVKATFKQMFQIELGSGLQYTYADGSPPSWPMHSHFSFELNEYLVSVQNKDASHLPLGFFKVLNYLSLFFSLLIIGWFVLRGEVSSSLILLLAVFVSFYFFNAAITGVLANVYERLQCRLLPLFPMFAMLVCFVWYEARAKVNDPRS